MRGADARPPRRDGGFTLLEVLVGTVVMAIIMAGTFSLLVSWNQVSNRNELLTQYQEQGRSAMDLITHDIRSAFYIYTYSYTKITSGSGVLPHVTDLGKAFQYLGVGGSGNFVPSGDAPSDGTFFTPMVTKTQGAGNVLVPQNYPNNLKTGGGTGWGSLDTDVLTMVASDMDNPLYICYFRFPAQAAGVIDPGYEQTVENQLIRVTQSCTTPVGVGDGSGAFLPDNRNWSDASLKYPSAATESVYFEPAPPGRNCYAPQAEALCPLENSAKAGNPVFTIQQLHPYSDAEPISPYWVTTHLMVGDPNSNVLNGGKNGKQYVSITMNSYASNVSIPVEAAQ